MSYFIYYWIGIIALCIVMYVVLDGWTLGMGITWPFLSKSERDIAISIILPTWDGNQTWLVLGSASLYGAFAPAFGHLLPILYIPLLVMVIALLLRGASLEFRLKAKKQSTLWDSLFFIASLIATLIQGIMLGSFVQGFDQGNHPLYEIFLSPFATMTALSLVMGYMLLGATRLIHKATGPVVSRMQKLAFYLSWGVMVMMGLVSLWTPFIHPQIKERWFNPHEFMYLVWLPITTAILFFFLIRSLYMKKTSAEPFLFSISLFICPYVGFCLSIYPYLIPYSMTLKQAASPIETLHFLSIGATIMLPVLLFYTFYAYRVFKGKVNEIIHY